MASTALEDASEKAGAMHKRKVSTLAAIKQNLMVDAGFDETFAQELAKQAMVGMDMASMAEAEMVAEGTKKALSAAVENASEKASATHKRKVSTFAAIKENLIVDAGFDETFAQELAKQAMVGMDMAAMAEEEMVAVGTKKAMNAAMEMASEKAGATHKRKVSTFEAIKENLMVDAGFDEAFALELAKQAMVGMDMAAMAEEEMVALGTEKAMSAAVVHASEKASSTHTRKESTLLAIKQNLIFDAGFDETQAQELASQAMAGMDMATMAEEEIIAEATKKALSGHKRRASQFAGLQTDLQSLGFDPETARRAAKRQLKKEAGTAGTLKREFLAEFAEDERVQEAYSAHSTRKEQTAAVTEVLSEFFDVREASQISKKVVADLGLTKGKAPMAPTRDEIIDMAASKALSSHKRKVSVLKGIKNNLMMDAGLDEDAAAKLARKTMIDIDKKKKSEEEVVAEATKRALGTHRRRVSQFAGLQASLVDLGMEESKAKQIAKQQMKKEVGTGAALTRQIIGEIGKDGAVRTAFDDNPTKKSQVGAMSEALKPYFDPRDAHQMAKKVHKDLSATDDLGTGRRGSVDLDDEAELVNTIKMLQTEVSRLRDEIDDQRDTIESLIESKTTMARVMNDNLDFMRSLLLAYGRGRPKPKAEESKEDE